MDRSSYELSRATRDIASIIGKLSNELSFRDGTDLNLRRINNDPGLVRDLVTRLLQPPRTLMEMIAAGGYDELGLGIELNVLERLLPVRPEAYFADGCRTFNFGRLLTLAEAAVEIQAQEGGKYVSGRFENLLAYGEKNPDEQLTHFIVAPGAYWTDPNCYLGPGHVAFPNLQRHGDNRVLYAYGALPDYRWPADTWFLGVPKYLPDRVSVRNP